MRKDTLENLKTYSENLCCMKRALYIFLAIKYIPILIYGLGCTHINGEIESFSRVYKYRYNKLFTLCYLLEKLPEFRTVYYYRTGCPKILQSIYKGQNNLEFLLDNDKIGEGLMVWHGYATVINALSIGSNFQVWHNVTIGKKSTEPIPDKPTIGDNVKICTGAIVVGAITIGKNVTIGAGAVITKNVPDNTIVVGNPARIVSKDGVKVNIRL